MSTVCSSARPLSKAASVTSLKSRTPQAGSRDFSPASKSAFDGAVCAPSRYHLAAAHERAVKDGHAVRPENASGSGQQAPAARPRRDVDHIGGENRIDVLGDRPGVRGDVEVQRRAQVGDVRGLGPGFDRGAAVRVGLGRLPRQAGEAGREIGGVLAAAGADLDHQPGFWKHALKNRRDGVAVASGGGRELSVVGAVVGAIAGAITGAVRGFVHVLESTKPRQARQGQIPAIKGLFLAERV